MTASSLQSLNNTARAFKNKIAAEVLRIEAAPGATDFADLQPLVTGSRGRAEVLEKGDVDGGLWTAGMVMGLIYDIPTCEVLLQRIIAEAREAAEKCVSLLLS